MMVGTKGSGADRSTMMNKPGMIFDVNANPGGGSNDPRWLNPPNLPPALMEFIGFWRDEMEPDRRPVRLTQRGEVPSGRATDKQVQAGQEAGFVRIRSALRNLELTLRKAGELLANLVIVNYDTARFVAIVGDEGETTSIRLAAQHFYSPTQQQDGKIKIEPLRFAMTVNAGSSKPTSRAARVQEANMLKGMNVVDDQRLVLQAYRVSHWKEVLARKQAQQAQEAQIAQMQQNAKQGPKKQPSTKGPS